MQKYRLFIGIDISKKWIDASLSLHGIKSKMLHSKFDNTEKGFSEMLRFIRNSQLLQNSLQKDCLFCMEHTGVYTLSLRSFLESKNLTYTMVNPLHLKYSLGLRRGKDDEADSRDIARYAFLYKEELQPSQLPSDQLLTIKHLLAFRRRLVKQKTAISNPAKELKGFAKAATCQAVLDYSDLQQKELEKLIKAVEKDIRLIIQEDQHLSRLYDLLLSIRGVGPIIAAYLLVYTVAFSAFTKYRPFAAFIGTAPFSQRSGSSLNRPAKVSHLAHKHLKGLISNGASSARKSDKHLKAYYKRRLEQGKNKHIVQNAIRNKYLARIFAVIQRGTPFIEVDNFRG